MAHYLVTGGGGFIGSNIARELLSRGEDVRVVDDFSTRRQQNIQDIRDDIDLHEMSICNLDKLHAAFDDIDFVLHQAAIPSVPRSVENPVTTTGANINGTLNVLLAARDAEVERVVMASSSSVYGDTPTLPKVETMRPAPMSPYAASKLANESYAKAFHEVYGLETVCLRYFNVFGPRQDPESQYAAVIPIFVTTMLDGERPTVFGDGEQSRDFSHVSNVIDANIKAANANKGAGEVFNIACGDRTTLNELIAYLNEILGTDIEAIYTDPRPGDVKHSLADISAAKEKLGYEPVVQMREGLEKVVEWYRQSET